MMARLSSVIGHQVVHVAGGHGALDEVDLRVPLEIENIARNHTMHLDFVDFYTWGRHLRLHSNLYG